MKRIIIVAAVVLLGVAASASTSSSEADATPNEKVTICHATSSRTNPYNVITVDASAVDEQNNPDLNGHGDHLGPVFPGARWGDIIPPFGDFPGYNWSAAGQAIWNNDCAPPPVLDEATPVAPTLVAPTCDAPGDVTIPTVTGVVYTTTVNSDGSITVTAAAADGYVLTDGATTTWTYTQAQLAQLPADSEACVASLPPTVTPPEQPTVVTPPVVTPPTIDGPAAVTPAVAAAPTAAPAETAAVPAAPTLPTTGSETWTIFLIGLTSLLAGGGLYRLSRHTA